MEPRTLSVLFSVCIGMAAFMILHVASWRTAPSSDPRFGLLGRLALVGAGISVLVSGLLRGFNGTDLCAVLWIDALAVTGYFFVYAGVARSVSITLLADLLRAPGGSLSLEAFIAEYAASSRFEDRIEQMRRVGLLRVSGETVTIAPKGATLSRGVKVLSALTCSEMRG